MNSVAQISQAAENIKKLSPNLLLDLTSSDSDFPAVWLSCCSAFLCFSS